MHVAETRIHISEFWPILMPFQGFKFEIIQLYQLSSINELHEPLWSTADSVSLAKILSAEKCKQAKMHQKKKFRQILIKKF